MYVPWTNRSSVTLVVSKHYKLMLNSADLQISLEGLCFSLFINVKG